MASILIIDDEPLMQDMLFQMLNQESWQVTVAKTSTSAMELIKTQDFDLIITDIIMPDVEGFEIIMFLTEEKPDIPIIAISGGARISPTSYLKIAEKMGARFVFEKPFKKDEFLNAIKECLAKES